MNAKNLIQMLCLVLIGFVTPMTKHSAGAADPDFLQIPDNLPTTPTAQDCWDYNVYWAFPAQSVFAVNYFYDGQYDHSYEYDCREDAEEAAFNYNRRNVDRYATVTEEWLPQIWFFYQRYELQPEAAVARSFIRSLGFGSRIRSTIDFKPKGSE